MMTWIPVGYLGIGVLAVLAWYLRDVVAGEPMTLEDIRARWPTLLLIVVAWPKAAWFYFTVLRRRREWEDEA
jgi:hypothetical protein